MLLFTFFLTVEHHLGLELYKVPTIKETSACNKVAYVKALKVFNHI